MRHRSDANQRAIIDALEKIGCTVFCVGRPVDLLVGRGAWNFLLECKSKTGRLTPAQKEFFATWKGQVRIVRSPEEAVRVVTESYGGAENQGRQ